MIYGAGVIGEKHEKRRICGHGDVRVPTRDVVMKCCRKAGLTVEKFEIRKGMRMHCVVRKPKGGQI